MTWKKKKKQDTNIRIIKSWPKSAVDQITTKLSTIVRENKIIGIIISKQIVQGDFTKII